VHTKGKAGLRSICLKWIHAGVRRGGNKLRPPLSPSSTHASPHLPTPQRALSTIFPPPRQTVYERLGHAEVVKVDIAAKEPTDVKREFKTFADTYFNTFRKTPFGMQVGWRRGE
jgi:hypothetical protein